MKYRKKPVVIEAIQWDGMNLFDIIAFVGSSLTYETYDEAWKLGVCPPKVRMIIKTLEGDHECKEGDYIIKGVQGEFYPCKPDIFELTYNKEPEEKPHKPEYMGGRS